MSDDRDIDMLIRVRAGEEVKRIAACYDLTYERVRQIVTALDPSATKVGRAVRLEPARIAREVEHAKQIAANPPCYVCWGPITNRVIRKRHRLQVVCGSRCCELLRVARVHLSEQAHEMHRLYVARSRIAHPETSRPADSRHAERVLASTAGRRPRAAGVRSPKVQAALDEVTRLRATNFNANFKQPTEVAS